MFHTLVHSIVIYLHHHPHAAGIIVFFIACGEALAVVGTVIPGSVTLTAVGVLIGSRVIPGVSTLIWAMSGAVVGDFLSYAIGLYYKKRIHKIWPFRKYPKFMEKGEAFFRKHGGKSVVIGRFFGPARSMVPLIAGTLNMRPGRFLLAAVPSACAWAICYMLPGILLGAISLEFPPGLAFEFIVAVLIIIALCVGLTWLIHFCSRHFAKKVDQATYKFWKYLRRGERSHWITSLLTDPRHPENHRQLILVVYALITAGLFLLLAVNVFTHGVLTVVDKPIANLLRTLRTGVGDDIMLVFTILGSKYVMLVSATLILLWFCIKRYWRIAVHWLAVIVLASGTVELMKLLLYSPRPDFLLHGPISSSFPSGHTCLTTCFLGTLAMLLAQALQAKYRRALYVTVGVIIGLVGLSRLYLTAHWLSDVVGSVLLGITIILLVTISYRRGDICHVAVKQFIAVVVGIFLLVWLAFGLYGFKTEQHNYSLYWPTYTISVQAWQTRTPKEIPLYRPSRFGHPLEAFNLEWLGRLKNIKHSLEQQGWKTHEPDFTVKGLLDRLSTTSTSHPLPLLPQLYHNKYPGLLMTKEIAHSKQAIILRLWQSNIKIKNTTTPLWLGIVSYRHKHHKWFVLSKIYAKKTFLGATDEFLASLAGFRWKEIFYPLDKQPKAMRKLHWDGKLLLVR